MKQEEMNYLSDVELASLIAEIENGQMKQAPEYLEQIIIRKAERHDFKESVEVIPIRTAIKEGTPVLPNEPSKWVQLFTYSTKIALAAAAAIALVVFVPHMEQEARDNSRPVVVEQEQTETKRHSVLHEFNTISGEICNKLFETTNLIFQREEQTDDTEKE